MPKLFIPTSIVRSLIQLLEADPAALAALADRLEVEPGRDESLTSYGEIAASLGVPHEAAFDGLTAIRFLEEQAESRAVSPADVIEQIRVAAARGNIAADVLDSRRGLVIRLVGPKPKAKLAAKRAELERGLGLFAESFRSVCDARPVFDLDRKAMEYLPVATLRIRSCDDAGEVKDVVLQLTGEGLGKLRQELEQIDRKLAVLAEDLRARAKTGGADQR